MTGRSFPGAAGSNRDGFCCMPSVEGVRSGQEATEMNCQLDWTSNALLSESNVSDPLDDEKGRCG